MKKLTALLLLLPALASADPATWMKKENPNKLFASSSVEGDCPLSTAEATSATAGVLIRSRIKPMPSGKLRETILYVRLRCLKDVTNWVYMLSVHLAKLETSAYYGLESDEISSELLGENWRELLPEEGDPPLPIPPSALPRFEIDLITTKLNSDYGAFGRTDKNGILTAVKEGVERAITDYLQANFDLGDDND